MNLLGNFFASLQRNRFVSEQELNVVLRLFQKSVFLLHMVAQALNYHLSFHDSQQIVDIAAKLLVAHPDVFLHYPQITLNIARKSADYQQALAVVQLSSCPALLRAQHNFLALELFFYQDLDRRQNRANMIVRARRRYQVFLLQNLLELGYSLRTKILDVLVDTYAMYPRDVLQIFKLYALWYEQCDFKPIRPDNVLVGGKVSVYNDVSDLYQSGALKSFFADRYERIRSRWQEVDTLFAEFERIRQLFYLSGGEIVVARDKALYELRRIGLV